MSSYKKINSEIDEGAVLVIAGHYKNRVGFYCLQNEQTFDMRIVTSCQKCSLAKGELTRSSTNLSESETIFDSPIEIETGTYCETHRKALIDHDMAVVYWDKPYGVDYSLVHPSDLVQIPSVVYARYEQECQKDVKEALNSLLKALDRK